MVEERADLRAGSGRAPWREEDLLLGLHLVADHGARRGERGTDAIGTMARTVPAVVSRASNVLRRVVVNLCHGQPARFDVDLGGRFPTTSSLFGVTVL
jgi:hypothetical protein